MKNKLIVTVFLMITVCCIVIWYVKFYAHTTPQLAIRTYLFLSGHPISAFTTGIVDDELHNVIDKNSLELQNAKCYSLTRPPRDEAGNYLFNFKVTKEGSMYYVQYYGEA
jgi:hypothetical protein